LLLGELIDREGRAETSRFKGSGRTPSRAAATARPRSGPMLREVLIGEAMHALGIPDHARAGRGGHRRAGVREQLLPGRGAARACAPATARRARFQFFAARGESTSCASWPTTRSRGTTPSSSDAPDRFLRLLARGAAPGALIAQWMNVGFIHGVMNTDNMTHLRARRIDYGPCAFMEPTTRSGVQLDRPRGRYAYGNQPRIAQWNLARLAEALLPLTLEEGSNEPPADAVAQARALLESFPALYQAALLRGQREKLGLDPAGGGDDAGDAALAKDWLTLLEVQAVDFTLAWRRLADAAAGDDGPLLALFAEPQGGRDWLARWRTRFDRSRVPPPNAQNACAAPTPGSFPATTVWKKPGGGLAGRDLGPFLRLLAALRSPYDEIPEHATYAEPAPAAVTARYQTFCGT
jgi:uncharacterized protein YdiU (UPF0061 family)